MDVGFVSFNTGKHITHHYKQTIVEAFINCYQVLIIESLVVNRCRVHCSASSTTNIYSWIGDECKQTACTNYVDML